MDTNENFDTEAMKRVLARSADIDRRRSLAAGASGYGLDDLYEVARNAGISEESVRLAAAAELAESRSYSRFFGGPKTIEARTVVRGASASKLRALLDRLPELAAVGGAGEATDGRLWWKAYAIEAMRGGRYYTVEVVPCESGLEACVSSSLGESAGGIVGGTMGGLSIGFGLAFSAAFFGFSFLPALIATAVALGPSYLAARKAFKLYERVARGRAEGLLDAIAESLGSR